MEDLSGDTEMLSQELVDLNQELVTFYDRHAHLMAGMTAMKKDLQRIIDLPMNKCAKCETEYYRLAADMVCERCFWKRMQH